MINTSVIRLYFILDEWILVEHLEFLNGILLLIHVVQKTKFIQSRPI